MLVVLSWLKEASAGHPSNHITGGCGQCWFHHADTVILLSDSLLVFTSYLSGVGAGGPPNAIRRPNAILTCGLALGGDTRALSFSAAAAAAAAASTAAALACASDALPLLCW
jgi:hypothetical protein